MFLARMTCKSSMCAYTSIRYYEECIPHNIYTDILKFYGNYGGPNQAVGMYWK